METPSRDNNDSKQLPRRQHPAHGIEVSDNGPTIVFLTVCTENRTPWLANETMHGLLREVWMEATA